MLTSVLFWSIAICVVPEFLSMEGNDSIPRIDGYDDLIPAEGMTISFICSSGLKLEGPDSATYRENGEWEPDLRGLMCKGE